MSACFICKMTPKVMTGFTCSFQEMLTMNQLGDFSGDLYRHSDLGNFLRDFLFIALRSHIGIVGPWWRCALSGCSCCYSRETNS